MHTGLESSRLDATSGSRPSLHSDCGEGLQGAVFSITQGKKATIYFTQVNYLCFLEMWWLRFHKNLDDHSKTIKSES